MANLKMAFVLLVSLNFVRGKLNLANSDGTGLNFRKYTPMPGI